MEMILQLIFDNQLEHVLYACQLLSVLMLNRILAGAISTLGACSIIASLAHGSSLATTYHCIHCQHDDSSSH
jgi:hypothetical protein